MTEAELGERASPEDGSCHLKTKDLSPAGVCRVRGRRQGEMALERWPLVSPSSWASLHRRVTGRPPHPAHGDLQLGSPSRHLARSLGALGAAGLQQWQGFCGGGHPTKAGGCSTPGRQGQMGQLSAHPHITPRERDKLLCVTPKRTSCQPVPDGKSPAAWTPA